MLFIPTWRRACVGALCPENTFKQASVFNFLLSLKEHLRGTAHPWHGPGHTSPVDKPL